MAASPRWALGLLLALALASVVSHHTRAWAESAAPAHLVIAPDTVLFTVCPGDTTSADLVLRNRSRDRLIDVVDLRIAHGKSFHLLEPPSLPLHLAPGRADTIRIRFGWALPLHGELALRTHDMPVSTGVEIPLRVQVAEPCPPWPAVTVESLADTLSAYGDALAAGDCARALRLLVDLTSIEPEQVESPSGRSTGGYRLLLHSTGDRA
jgi:hypothetical protein